MPQILHPGAPVGKVANATQTTGVPKPPCSTPGCTWHASFRATVDLHLPLKVSGLRFGTDNWSTVYLPCLCCYGRLRRLQSEAYAEILEAEGL